METGHVTTKAVRPADTSRPPTRSCCLYKILQGAHICHLQDQGCGLSDTVHAESAQNITSVQQKMSCTSASMATDMTSET